MVQTSEASMKLGVQLDVLKTLLPENGNSIVVIQYLEISIRNSIEIRVVFPFHTCLIQKTK